MKRKDLGIMAPAQLCSTVLGQKIVYHKKTFREVTETPQHIKKDVRVSAKVSAALHGAQKNLNDSLFTAVTEKNIPLIARLIKQGADVNTLHKDGLSPLHWAVMHKDLGLVACLLSNGADPNVRGPYKNTALHEAALQADRIKLKIVEVLIVAGANVNAQNKLGQTALHFHKSNDPAIYYKIAQLLLRAGAHLHLVDIKGNEPFHTIQDQKLKAELMRMALFLKLR